MALLEWTEKMSVGIDTMDTDHKKLIDLVNTLHAVVRKKESVENIARIMRELSEYTDYHFEAEEQLLRLIRYPDIEGHIQNHRALQQKVREMEDKYRSNPKQGTLKLFDFLSDWLMRHILGDDMRYKPLLLEKLGQKRPPKEGGASSSSESAAE